MTIKYAESTIILEGGVRDGWVYYESDWAIQCRSEIEFGRVVNYEVTEYRSSRGVPLGDDHLHTVWQYRGSEI